MKKLIWLFAFIILFQVPETKEINHYNDMKMLAVTAEEMGLNIQEWQDIYIEETSIEAFENLIPRLYKNYKVDQEKNKQLNKYIFTQSSSKDEHVEHEIHAQVPAEGQKVKIQIILSNNYWNHKSIDDYISVTKQMQNDYGFNLGESFACAKMNDDGIIPVRHLRKDIIDTLQAIHIDEQSDNVTDSIYERIIYGRSALFDEGLNVDDEQINFQAVIKKTTNQKRQVIIGTPIMLDEY